MKIDNKKKCFIGMTLVEMMIAIGIFFIGIEGFTILFARSWQSNHYILEMGQASLAASRGVSNMVAFIRGTRQSDNGSYPIVSASDNDFVLYADYDKDNITERLHFYKSDSNIIVGITNPTGTMPKTYPSGDEETQIIAKNVVNGANEPIFYYYNKNYPSDAENNPLDTPAIISEIRLVKIYLFVNIDPNRAPDNVKMQSMVELRNLNDYDRID